MGQHKYNPTAIKAKNGEIPPKPPRMSKREQMIRIEAEIRKRMGIDRILEELESDIMELVVNDAKDDVELVYTKATLDRGLAQILGQENLVPYDIRYGSRI